ncbi:hypothetical protein, partial [Burkholderia gladioli]|uniref:hypothetical protein n=1 Tax=Burkholderia gladioli TaxID=28095 RepID=UPI00163FBC89
SGAAFADFVYWFDVAKEEFDERVAFVVDGVDALLAGLDALVAGAEDAAAAVPTIRGRARRERATRADEATLAALIQRREYASLARLWADGQPIDWARLFEGARPGPLALEREEAAVPPARPRPALPAVDAPAASSPQPLPALSSSSPLSSLSPAV